MATTTRLTADEYLTRREWPPFTELIGGELVVNQASDYHQWLVGELYALLREWARAAPGRGRAGLSVDVRVDEHDVYAPDVWWNAGPGGRPSRDSVYLATPPDLAVEVRSPSTWRYDLGPKKTRYEAQGLPELWLVDWLAGTVLIYRRSAPGAPAFDVALELGRGEALTSPQLPGFALDLAALFDEA